jgi:hypothetical protein
LVDNCKMSNIKPIYWIFWKYSSSAFMIIVQMSALKSSIQKS